jgi:hypothetical protein
MEMHQLLPGGSWSRRRESHVGLPAGVPAQWDAKGLGVHVGVIQKVSSSSKEK